MGDSEDSFEDFLEWRKWKRERARGGASAAPTAAAPAAAPAVRSAAPVAAVSAVSVPAASGGKGKEEVSRSAVTNVAVPSAAPPAAAAPAASKVVAVPAAVETNSVSSAGEKFVADLAAASEKGKKELRNAVLAETRAILAAGKYTTESGTVVELDTAANAGKTVFSDDHKFASPPSPYNTTAHFVKADAIDTALFLIEKKGVNPLVVVPADPKNIGGGFAGSSSLEEQLYRRSTALLAVEGEKYDIPNHGSIYLPAVQVFRDGEARAGYQLVKAPRKVSFLLASSVEKPKSEAKGRSFVLEASARSDLEAKVTAILSAGIEKGHDAIVFTAFGCGFNQAPPQAVAAVFRDLLTGKFSNTYKHVTFAILEDENCMKSHNPNGNLLPFQQEFLTVSKSGTSSGKCCSK